MVGAQRAGALSTEEPGLGSRGWRLKRAMRSDVSGVMMR